MNESPVVSINGRFYIKQNDNYFPVNLGSGGRGKKGDNGLPGAQGPQGSNGAFPYANDEGIVNKYAVTLPFIPSPFIDGYIFEVKISNSNTLPSTMNVNLTSDLPLLDTDLNPLSIDDIEKDSIYLISYNQDYNGLGNPAWAVLGLAKPSVKINPLTNVFFVDKNTATETPDGSIANPYKTIQSAIDSVVAFPSPLRKTYNIVISPDTYDEDLTIDITGRRIVLTSWGSWNLGQFNNADWSPSGTLRNITIIGNSASSSGMRCGLTISSYSSTGQRYSTHQSYISGCRISGAVIVKLSSGGASLELDLQAEVFGTDGTSAGNSFYIDGGNGNSAPILQIYLYNGRWHGKFNGGTASNLQNAEYVRFGGLLTTPNYSLINCCRFNTGINVSGGSGNVFPDGIINTRFDSLSTFTGLARVDTYTNYWLVTNGVVPTSKTILYSIAP